MKMKFFAALSAFLILTLTGCGSDHNDPPPLFVTEILSDATIDGDIQLDFTGALTIAQGNTESVFAGIDPVSGDEYRAFLHFPLASVPATANIQSAFLEIFINNIVTSTDRIPLRIDLVSFQPPVLIESDFNFQARLTVPPVTFPIFLTDLGEYVRIDVTPLMIAAQRPPQLADFQIRIMMDFETVPPGKIEINDTTNPANRNTYAPLLTVNYFL
jgi:hypothetical protein